MRDQHVFWRFFRWTLLIFLALWGVMAGVLVRNNYIWQHGVIEMALASIPQDFEQQREAAELRLYQTNLDRYGGQLYGYKGQLAFRTYDEWGNTVNRSQLLVGEFVCEGESHYINVLFDEVLTEVEELELFHRILDLKRELGGDNWEGGTSLWKYDCTEECYVEISGAKDLNRLFPLRIIFHKGDEAITLLDLGPERYQNRTVTTLETNSINLYGGLVYGPGTPEERLESFRKLEANLDTLDERMEGDFPNENYSMTILPSSMTRCYHSSNYSLALSYQVDPYYMFYGLEWVLTLTFLFALLLAVFTAHIQARAVRRERDFTRAAAHELKTPLAILRTHAEALQEDISPEKRGAYLSTILDESDRMSALVGQLLDLSRLNAGAELCREALDLDALVQGVFDRLAPAAAQGEVTLSLNLEPLPVEGDRRRLEELVTELGANALKHCPPGGTVRVSLYPEFRKAHLTVENDGPALSKEDLSHLWEPFYKGDRSRNRAAGGSGLGLALVRGAVEAHKGICWAENIPGGVRFAAELPILQSPA